MGVLIPAGSGIGVFHSQREEWLRVVEVLIAWPFALRLLDFFVLLIMVLLLRIVLGAANPL